MRNVSLRIFIITLGSTFKCAIKTFIIITQISFLKVLITITDVSVAKRPMKGPLKLGSIRTNRNCFDIFEEKERNKPKQPETTEKIAKLIKFELFQ